jgi:hypothetical protein
VRFAKVRKGAHHSDDSPGTQKLPVGANEPEAAETGENLGTVEQLLLSCRVVALFSGAVAPCRATPQPNSDLYPNLSIRYAETPAEASANFANKNTIEPASCPWNRRGSDWMRIIHPGLYRTVA